MNLKEHLKDFILDLEEDLNFEEILAEMLLESKTLRYREEYNPNFEVWSEIRWSRYNEEERSNIRTRVLQSIQNLESLEDYDLETLDIIAEGRKIGEEIIEGLKNAIEYAKGDTTKGTQTSVFINKE